MKGIIRDSGISTRLTCHTTDHTAVAPLYSYPSVKTLKRKPTKKKRNKKSYPKKPNKRDLLHKDTIDVDNYNKQVKELIIECLHENDKAAIHQPSLIPILVEASKSFPEMKSSKNDWFKKR